MKMKMKMKKWIKEIRNIDDSIDSKSEVEYLLFQTIIKQTIRSERRGEITSSNLNNITNQIIDSVDELINQYIEINEDC